MSAPLGNKYSPGRPKGMPNRTTMIVKDLFAKILEEEQDNFREALEHLRVNSPRDYVVVMVKLSQRFLPEMNVTALAGLNGESIAPVQIVIPPPPSSEATLPGFIQEQTQIEDQDHEDINLPQPPNNPNDDEQIN